MSLWTRITNALRRGDSVNREIDEELESHVEEALGQGRDRGEALRAFGSRLQLREASRDVRLVAWLDSLRADAVFGWRQLVKNNITSSAAILSLALGIGACTSAFRLIDALLLRPLPVTNPELLYSLTRSVTGMDGKVLTFDSWAYPAFERMRAAVGNDAELIAVSYVERVDLTYASGQEMEKAHLQYVSGSMFPSFGSRPTLGRLFTPDDDMKPGAHPYAVLSYDYWTRRFAQDRRVIGQRLHIGAQIYEIVGVGPATFTGTETGTFTDLFVPTVMHPGVTRSDWQWHRTLAHIKPGRALEPIRSRLHAISRAVEEERAKGLIGVTREMIHMLLDQKVEFDPALAGTSELQHEYRRALTALGVLVALVLLIACANVANLMTAQAASRAREMALRVSIGAGRFRLIQLVLVESGWISLLAATAGGLFAWWSAPLVVSLINPPDNPARLSLPWDWRVLGFDLALTLAVTILFGLTPALRASAVHPASALKGGDHVHSRRFMQALIAAQVAFCFLVLFVSGLFAASFERLSNKPTGFSAERVLTAETVAETDQPPIAWEQLAAHLRGVPGVESVAYASDALLSGNSWNQFISVNGASPSQVTAYLLGISPGWVGTMKLRLLDGRDFRVDEPSSQVAIVNQAFVKQFFNGENPLGRRFKKSGGFDHGDSTEIVGIVNDAAYRSLREPIQPVAYIPILDGGTADSTMWKRTATLIVRTAGPNPVALAPALRQEIIRVRPDFRVANIRTQLEINQAQTVRERLLAMLALFFAVVALLLAGIGLYGVLDYTVLQRRRELGIRIAIGAPVIHIARLVSVEMLGVVTAGAGVGCVVGMASARYIESLFFEVKPTDLVILAIPSLMILGVVILAALRPVIHAIRIDPVTMLRAD